MKLIQSILTRNPCYAAGRNIMVRGLMLHSVGCPQPKASVFVDSWNRADYGNACVHGFIDAWDGTVYQTLPWNHRGWHCGAGSRGSGNDSYIGVEMCEPACIKYTAGSSFTSSDMVTAKACAKRTYDAAAELFAMLCKEYGLDPTAGGVIISHAEGHARGIASNHGDPEHLWKGLGMPYTMNGFRNDVKKEMETSASSGVGTEKKYYRVRKSWEDAASQKGAFTVLANAKVCVDENPGYSVFDEIGKVLYSNKSAFVPYLIRVVIPDLNIRKGPGTGYLKTGNYTGRGTFTIVGEETGIGSVKGWGQLKSGVGWVSLDYAVKV